MTRGPDADFGLNAALGRGDPRAVPRRSRVRPTATGRASSREASSRRAGRSARGSCTPSDVRPQRRRSRRSLPRSRPHRPSPPRPHRPSPAARVEPGRRADPARRQARACAAADPRLSRARPPHRQERPARGRARLLPGARPGALRLRKTEDLEHLYRVGSELPGEPVQTLGQILDRLKRTYCGTDRRRVHARPGSRPPQLAAPAIMEEAENHPRPRRARVPARPREAVGRRALRALPPHQVPRPEALLARGRRVADPAARHDRRGRAPARGIARSCSAWRTAAG